MPAPITFILPFAAFALLLCLFSAIKILRQYERAVVFTLGKFQAVRGRASSS